MTVKFKKEYTDIFEKALYEEDKCQPHTICQLKATQYKIIESIDMSHLYFIDKNNYTLDIEQAELLYHPFELMIRASKGSFFQTSAETKHDRYVIEDDVDKKVAVAAYLGNNQYIELLHHYNLYDFTDSNSFCTTNSGTNHIDIATQHNNIQMVKTLLEAGAKPDACEYKTIRLAANDDIAELLLAHGARTSMIESDCLEDIIQPKLETALEKIENKFNFYNFREDCLPQEKQIPHKIHYIWLTDPEHPTEAPESHLNITRSTVEIIKNQTNYNDWQFIYHTNSIGGAYKTTQFFRNLDFKVVDLNSEYHQFETGSSLLNLFIDSKKWGMAADLARYEIINSQGGIYYDLNFNGTRALDHEVCAYDNFNFIGGSVENYFVASAKNHPILQNIIDDYKNIFYGNSLSREYFVRSLNTTIKDETDELYLIFPLNSYSYMTNESIIFRFEKFYGSSDFCGAEIPLPSLIISEELLADVKGITPINQCTSNEVLPFGEDSQIDGRSW